MSSHSPFVASIDQGTTSTRCIIFDRQGQPQAMHQVEFPHYHPHPGWHEQDPVEILESVQTCIERAVENFEQNTGKNRQTIRCIGLTNQRETTVVWDTRTGQPLCRAIAWPDTRTSALVREFKEHPGAEELHQRCGLPLSTYPSAVKLVWLLQNNDAVRKVYDEGCLAFGTVDTWLLYRLATKSRPTPDSRASDDEIFVTDATNASRTMLADLQTLQYSDASLAFFGLDRRKLALPRIVPSSDSHAFGVLKTGPLAGVPITGCLGDQSAALVGHGAFDAGEAKNTYGTGCFLLYNVGSKPVASAHGLLATVAYHLGGEPGESRLAYALEGSVAAAGSAVGFLTRNWHFAPNAKELSLLAATVNDSGGCVFVTAFSGLFAPYWIDDAQGTLFGLTHHTQRGHVARAVLDAVCFQTRAILTAMEKDSGRQLASLAVDGGMSESDLCMQTQAELISIPVERPAMRESTALGAAMAAGLASGIWTDLDALRHLSSLRDRTIFAPSGTAQSSDRLFQRWERAVKMSRGWLQDEDDQGQQDAKEPPE